MARDMQKNFLKEQYNENTVKLVATAGSVFILILEINAVQIL